MPEPSPAPTRSVLLLGATGLVGRECLRFLLADAGVERVVVLARRRLVVPRPSPRFEEHVVNFERLSEHPQLFAVDQVVCALGTTIKQAGSQEQFRRVDFDYPLEAARLGLARGARHFLLVSALGADAHSRVFYNRVKGELEDAVRALPYRSLTIVRPSLLLGNRAEFRLGERLGALVGVLVPGKYRPVHAWAVAATLARAAREDRPGPRIIESDEIRRLVAG